MGRRGPTRKPCMRASLRGNASTSSTPHPVGVSDQAQLSRAQMVCPPPRRQLANSENIVPGSTTSTVMGFTSPYGSWRGWGGGGNVGM